MPGYKTPNLFKSIKVDDNNSVILNHIEKHSFEDRAFGLILGSFIGDSCGSYLVRSYKIENEFKMDTCMEMNGGGPFGATGSGQITSDSELAMCLMHGIIDANSD